MKKLMFTTALVLMILLNACTPKQPNPVANVDVRDKNSLHQYVKSEIADVSWDQFAEWQMVYCDVTGDGSDDVVLVSPNVAWHDKVEIISANGGQFKRIESHIPLYKYTNAVAYEDGFLVLRGNTGGPGEHFAFMDLYVLSDSQMISVLDGLLVEHTVSFPGVDYEQKVEIEGGLYNFTYTLIRHDNLTNNTSAVKTESYIYRSSTKSFVVTPLPINQASERLHLHLLSNGDSVGRGLTIEDIDFDKGRNSAAFTLLGDLQVNGWLALSESDGNIAFTVDINEPLPIFVVEGSFDTVQYSPRFLTFRNIGALEKLLPAETLEGINAGRTFNTVMNVNDIRVDFRIGTCAGGTICTFVSMGN